MCVVVCARVCVCMHAFMYVCVCLIATSIPLHLPAIVADQHISVAQKQTKFNTCTSLLTAGNHLVLYFFDQLHLRLCAEMLENVVQSNCQICE